MRACAFQLKHLFRVRIGIIIKSLGVVVYIIEIAGNRPNKNDDEEEDGKKNGLTKRYNSFSRERVMNVNSFSFIQYTLLIETNELLI